MLYFLIPLPPAVAFGVLAWHAKEVGDFAHAAVYQPLATVFLVVTAVLSLLNRKSRRPYTIWITLGLMFSLGCDVMIIDPDDPVRFLIGLIFTLFAHIAYASGFTVLSGFRKQDLRTGIVFGIVYIGFMTYIWKGLGAMMIPVTIYAFALSFMAWRAVSTLFGEYFTKIQAVFIAIGSLLFFAADSLYALYLFHPPVSLTPGLLLYYGGQTLFAVSPSLFLLRERL